MPQSFKGSVVENISNTGSGIILAYLLAQAFSFFAPEIRILIPEFDFHISPTTNVITTPIFTLISALRGIVWRRTFIKYWRG